MGTIEEQLAELRLAAEIMATVIVDMPTGLGGPAGAAAIWLLRRLDQNRTLCVTAGERDLAAGYTRALRLLRDAERRPVRDEMSHETHNRGERPGER